MYHSFCDMGAVVGSYFHCLGSRLRISPRYWGYLQRGGLLVARVARAAHTTILSNYLLFFCVFNFCTLGTKVRHTVFVLSVGFIFICFYKNSRLVAFQFVLIKIKVHRLIFNTNHTDGVNIPHFQTKYKYQYGMQ